MANEDRVLVLCQLSKTADSVAYTLRSHGLDVVASSDPAEALAALRKQPCDLAIVHVKLNAGTGLEFLTKARDSCSKTI
jgi:DNA-binding response OmpR family regulator